MRYLSIVLSTSVPMLFAVACDNGDVPGRDVPRTVPPAGVRIPLGLPESAPPVIPGKKPVHGVGPILEAAGDSNASQV